ncbi:MAG: hypothetical protein KH135_04970 [Firmicutes bacterium]|nr:hypothetical protein [Bacillota bacterium]
MITKIDLPNGRRLEFGPGKFDDFCVYYVNEKLEKKAPTDIQCFQVLKELSEVFDREEIYDDFVSIYQFTKKEIREKDVIYIESFGQKYGRKATFVFLVLYMAMIAEENKKNTKLGKRIKRLGVHYLLIENHSVEESACFMKGLSAEEISILCKERGF